MVTWNICRQKFGRIAHIVFIIISLWSTNLKLKHNRLTFVHFRRHKVTLKGEINANFFDKFTTILLEPDMILSHLLLGIILMSWLWLFNFYFNSCLHSIVLFFCILALNFDAENSNKNHYEWTISCRLFHLLRNFLVFHYKQHGGNHF